MAVGLIATHANSILTTMGTTYKYVQLHTGDPGSAGTASVATETDRVQVTWDTAAAGAMSNDGALAWTAVGGSETYTHFSVWSASTSGSCGFTGTVTANAVTAGDNFTIPDGDLDVSLTVAA